MNKIRKLNTIILVLIMLIVNFYMPVKVAAKTLGQLKSELKAAEEKYSDNQTQKAQTEEEIAATKAKIEELKKEKIKIQGEISDLNDEIVKLNEDIAKKQEEIKQLINYYQISNGESAYLEYAFDAADFTDFIYRMAIVEQLSDYNDRLIDEYNRLIEENKKKLEELSAKEVSLNKLQDELSNELAKLGKNLSSISEAAIDIKDEIKDLKSEINKYQNTYKCSDNEEISTCLNRYYSSSSGGMPSAAGFYRPVTAGRVNANYGYSDYYGSYHDGLDIGVSHGTAVYPIADGRVVKISPRSSCGGNMIYVAHNVNGVKYTSGYFHLASINVYEGQVVTAFTVIGYSGGVPWIETWDGCSTGAHLHLQIATGTYMTDYFWYSNYQARSFDPRRVINFPGWGEYFQGR